MTSAGPCHQRSQKGRGSWGSILWGFAVRGNPMPTKRGGRSAGSYFTPQPPPGGPPKAAGEGEDTGLAACVTSAHGHAARRLAARGRGPTTGSAPCKFPKRWGPFTVQVRGGKSANGVFTHRRFPPTCSALRSFQAAARPHSGRRTSQPDGGNQCSQRRRLCRDGQAQAWPSLATPRGSASVLASPVHMMSASPVIHQSLRPPAAPGFGSVTAHPAESPSSTGPAARRPCRAGPAPPGQRSPL